jgi:glyoxylase-like metal-dependent hydrolase (beta-lactamase superfamily II)
MRQIADGVWQLRLFPPNAINVYLVGDILFDAATRWGQSPLLSQLRNRPIRMVALTHCHPDHQGCAKIICEQRGIPLACHEADVPAMEGRAPMGPENWILRLGHRLWSGAPCRVDRVFREGDEVGGFRVIHAPGHTPGHVIYFRDADRLAIAGDVLANINFLTWQDGLRQPPSFFSVDPAENRRSILKLVELKPNIICLGHGRPLHDRRILERFVSRRSRSRA